MIAFAGGAECDVRKVLSGGPMMGFNVADTGISTTKTTSGLTLLTEKSVFQYSSHACINCGTCLRACPMNLNPAAISCAVESDDIAFAENYGVMNCIECGACSFSCPAYRDITQNCRRAKASIRTRIAREKAAAAAASEKRS
jgi:electron transport complex protein RnfC